MVMAFLRRHWWWIVPLLIFDIFFFIWLWNRPDDDGFPETQKVAAEDREKVTQEPETEGLVYGYPTEQRSLHKTESIEVYQPTASGRVQSALYGSVRTVQRSGRLRPSFHAGLDIAAMRRDRRGRPLDEIYAVADGEVAYINRIGGNSSYGIYVVLLHQDPAGDIYTLYAHMASAEDSLDAGQEVRRGDVLGIMGNTASTGIPMHRAHLHFEIGVVNNMRFHSWYRKQDLIPDHGTFHGHNLTAADPLALYGEGGDEIVFSMLDHLREEAPAFELVFRHDRHLDYFERYPGLWKGPRHDGEAIWMAVSHGGVPLKGRTATDEEAGDLGNGSSVVVSVNEDVLGRNGRHLVVRRGSGWQVGRNGERMLEIFSY